MTTYRTGNPIGSADPRDLYDNAENLDELVNSQDKAEHPDRLGVPRKTWHGMEEEFVGAQADKQQRFNLLLANSGYEYLADYAGGIEITEYNQVLRDAAGELWRLSASVDLPYITTGAGMPEGGAFVSVGDAALRQELGAENGALMVRGAVIYVDTVADLQALDTSGLVDGQVANVQSAVFRWGGLGIGWQPESAVSPEMFGATGDGSADDTQAVVAWWEYPYKHKTADGRYRLSAFSALMEGDLSLTGAGTFVFENGDNSFHGLRVQTNGGESEVKGVSFEGAGVGPNNVLFIEALSPGGVVTVDGVKAANFKNRDVGSICIIMITGEFDSVEVKKCDIRDIFGPDVDPGPDQGVPVGIGVFDVSGTVEIHSNTLHRIGVEGVTQRGNSIDVFDSTRLIDPPVHSTAKVSIYNNAISSYVGRAIKLQSPGDVYHNKILMMEDVPVSGSRDCIDYQAGGGSCYGNTLVWDSPTFFSDNSFIKINIGKVGAKSGNYHIKDNYVRVLSGRVTHYVLVTMADSDYDTKDLVVSNNLLSHYAGSSSGINFVQISGGSGTPSHWLNTYVDDNKIYVENPATINLLFAASSASWAYSKALMSCMNNTITGSIASSSRSVRTGSGSTFLPALLRLGNNSTATPGVELNTIWDAPGLKPENVLAGSCFYYNSSGGDFINATGHRLYNTIEAAASFVKSTSIDQESIAYYRRSDGKITIWSNA